MRSSESWFGPGREAGSILVFVLWVLLFLVTLGLAARSAVTARIELARRLASRSAAYGIARAGVETARAVMGAHSNVSALTAATWRHDPERFHAVRCGGGAFTVWHATERADGSRGTNWGVVAEEARVNLNRADRQLLAALFATAGGCGSNEAARIAAAVVERRRPAPEEGPGPAPSERGLTGPFESVYELLLVDGVTPGLFSQVEPRVTVFGEGSRIDINTADAITLESVARRVEPEAEAGIGRSLAAKVIGSRERGNVFTNRTAQGLCEALGRWETLSPAETQLLTKMAPVITVSGSRFRGRVGARLDRAPREAREIEFVWDPAAQRIRFWHED